MIKNYLKIALQNLIRNPLYSIVNITGLVIGLTVVMLVSMYVQDDLLFDRFHAQGKNIYRLVQDMKLPDGKIAKMGNTGIPQGPAFAQEIPEITSYCRFKNGWNTIIKKGNTGLKEELMYVDHSIQNIFSFDVLSGDSKTALKDKSNVIITDRLAKKHFGFDDPIGEILTVSDQGGEFKPYKISAVVKQPPQNSSIQFDLLLSYEHIIPTDPAELANYQNWFNASLNTFLLVQDDVSIPAVEEKMNTVSKKFYGDTDNKSKTPNKNLRSIDYHLQPLHQMHLDPEYYATNGMKFWSDARYPKILAGLGLLVLLIACMNYINLTIARSIRRTKEISLRKIVGGSKSQLITQFLSESFFTSLIAFIPAVLLTKALLPSFGLLTDKYLDPAVLFNTPSLFILFGLLLIVSLLAGLYPGFVLSKFNPIDSLKGKLNLSGKNTLGRGLVVFQFTIATALILCSWIGYRQFEFIAQKDLGYKTDNIIRFWLPWDQIEKIAEPFKNELKQLSFVKNVSAKSGDWNSTSMTINGTRSEYIYYEHIDDAHLQLLQIPLVKGRYFSNSIASDTITNIVVNESFVHKYIPKEQDPFQTEIKHGSNQYMNIVGVIKDFHYSSFKELIKPIVWYKDDGTQAGCIHIELTPGDHKEALAQIQGIYKKYVPYLPMEYYFLEDFRMQRYADDLLWKKIFTSTSILAILIACMGLFAMATYMTSLRTKEIGVRKVLGASVSNITTLLSKDFIALVSISVILASPIAYILMNKWLAEFAYRTSIYWWTFLIAGALAVGIAVLTISYQAIKAAVANPVDSLRSE